MAQESEADRALIAAMVVDLRRRQNEGELAPELDPRAVLLALFGAVSAPILLPQISRRIYGGDDGTQIGEEYGEQLRQIVRGLRSR